MFQIIKMLNCWVNEILFIKNIESVIFLRTKNTEVRYFTVQTEQARSTNCLLYGSQSFSGCSASFGRGRFGGGRYSFSRYLNCVSLNHVRHLHFKIRFHDKCMFAHPKVWHNVNKIIQSRQSIAIRYIIFLSSDVHIEI